MAICSNAWSAPAVAVYGKLPSLDLVRLSPSGERMAFVAVDGEKRKLFIRKVNGDALLVSQVGDAKVRDIEWAGENYLLIIATFTMKVGNGLLDRWVHSSRIEPATILIVNVQTGKISRIFEHEKAEMFLGQAIHLGSRQTGGRWYEFVKTYDVRFGVYIYKIDLETGAPTVLSHYQGPDYAYMIGADGSVVVRSHYDEPTRTWTVFAGAEGRRTVTAQRSDLDLVGLAGMGRTPGTVLVHDLEPDIETVKELSVDSGASMATLFDGLTIDHLLTDPTTHLLIGGVLSRGQGAVLFDSKLQHRYDAIVKAFPGLHVSLESISANMGRAVVFTDGGDDPGTYWLIDMATGKAQDLMSAYPAVDPRDVALTSLFKYRASDGLALEAVLTLPPGAGGKRLPLVVIPHGGPIDVYDDLGFSYWAQAFATRGYAVLQPNYRGSGGYGPIFRQAGFGQWGHRMLTDISDGVTALANAGAIDPKRVCIVGASYGGYAALASVTLMSGIYRCAVSVSGVTDVGAIMAQDGDKPDVAEGRYVQAMFGASFAGAKTITDISPLRHADKASAPILLIHGKDDTRVPFVHSLSMDVALTKAGKPVTFIPLDGEDHFWSHENTRVQILTESVAFVQKHNPAP